MNKDQLGQMPYQQQMNPKEMEEQRKKQEEILEKRKIMLQNFMTSEAKERRMTPIFYFIIWLVNRLALVKPDKAQKIEDMIIQNASAGVFKEKVSEAQLIAYLEQFSEKQEMTIKVCKYPHTFFNNVV